MAMASSRLVSASAAHRDELARATPPAVASDPCRKSRRVQECEFMASLRSSRLLLTESVEMPIVAADEQVTVGGDRAGVARTPELVGPAHFAVGLPQVDLAGDRGNDKVVAGNQQRPHGLEFRAEQFDGEM